MNRHTLATTPVTRRSVLAGGAVAGVAAFLAACGGGTTAAPSGAATVRRRTVRRRTERTAAPSGEAKAAQLRELARLHRPDRGRELVADADRLRDAQHGIEVNYVEDIQSNEDFFATVAPALDAGLDTGWDIIVLTDYMAARLVRLGWVEAIEAANVPTALANVRDELRGLEWDPEMKFHFPWQSGATGVGYNVKSTGRELTSIADLFDDAFKGKVTLLTGYQDTFSLVSLLLRERGEITNLPPDLTVDDAQKIKDFLQPYVDSGHIRASPATSTCRTSARATHGSPSSGPATWPPPAARTTGSSTPRRGRSSGPTTC